MYGRKYVWFFIGWYEDDWFQKLPKEENINCTLEEMAKAAEGHFTTEALQWNQDRSPTISGQVGLFFTEIDFRDKAKMEPFEILAKNLILPILERTTLQKLSKCEVKAGLC